MFIVTSPTYSRYIITNIRDPYTIYRKPFNPHNPRFVLCTYIINAIIICDCILRFFVYSLINFYLMNMSVLLNNSFLITFSCSYVCLSVSFSIYLCLYISLLQHLSIDFFSTIYLFIYPSIIFPLTLFLSPEIISPILPIEARGKKIFLSRFFFLVGKHFSLYLSIYISISLSPLSLCNAWYFAYHMLTQRLNGIMFSKTGQYF